MNTCCFNERKVTALKNGLLIPMQEVEWTVMTKLCLVA